MTDAIPDGIQRLVWIGGATLLLGLMVIRLRARRDRPGSALGPFLRHFEAEGLPVEVAASVFRQLQRWMEAQGHGFAVRHDQDLASVYGLVPAELDAALLRMARECGRRFDPAEPHPPLESVGDLVAELARCPEDES